MDLLTRRTRSYLNLARCVGLAVCPIALACFDFFAPLFAAEKEEASKVSATFKVPIKALNALAENEIGPSGTNIPIGEIGAGFLKADYQIALNSLIFSASEGCIRARCSGGLTVAKLGIKQSFNAKAGVFGVLSFNDDLKLEWKSRAPKGRFLETLDAAGLDLAAVPLVGTAIGGAIGSLLGGILAGFDDSVQSLWNETLKPARLDGVAESPFRKSTWLQLRPMSLAVSDVGTDAENVVFRCQLKATPLITIGDEPTPEVEPLKGHALTGNPEEDSETRLRLQTVIGFQEVEDLLRRELCMRPLEFGPKKLLATNATLTAEGNRVKVSLACSQPFQGVIHLVGTPQYSAKAKTLTIPDLDYAIETKDLLSKVAAWVFQSRLRETIRESAVVDMREQLDPLHESVKSGSMTVHDGIALEYAFPTVALESVKVTKKSFLLTLLAKGQLTFQIKDITPLVEQFK